MKPTVCLTMIVKDEAHVIARCLRSVRRMINTYVIADTGSTDDTKAVIARELAGLPGVILDRPWKDFATNRNEVLDAAHGHADYNLVIDADDVLAGSLPGTLTADYYTMTVVDRLPGVTWGYARVHIWRNRLPLRYRYSIHEQLEIPKGGKLEAAHVSTLQYVRNYDGARSTKEAPGAGMAADRMRAKWLRDADVCRAALASCPPEDRPHYAFYLAQSVHASGDLANAIVLYQAFVRLASKVPELSGLVWQALFRIATSKVALAQATDGEILDAFFRAYERNPARVEPMYELGMYLHARERYRMAYHLLRPLVNRPMPPADGTPRQIEPYQWGVKDLVAGAALMEGDLHTARQLYEQLLQTSELPDGERARIAQKYQEARTGLGPDGLPLPWLADDVKRGLAKDAADAGASADEPAAVAEVEVQPEVNRRPAVPLFGEMLGELRKQIQPGAGEYGYAVSLFSLVVATRARHVLEIGRHKGMTTLALACACKLTTEEPWAESAWAKVKQGFPYSKFEEVGGVRKVYSVDPSPMPEAVTLLDRYGLKKYVTLFNQARVTRQDILSDLDVLVLNAAATEESLRQHLDLVKVSGYVVLYGTNDKAIGMLASATTWQRIAIDTGYRGFVVFRKGQ